jgi:hypothetical protein
MEIIFYMLFLLLFVYGAWLIISSTQKKKPRLLQLPAHQDIYPGHDYPGQDEILQNPCHGQDEILQDYPGQNYLGEDDILHQQQKPRFQIMAQPNKERQRLETEHKQMLTEALKGILTSEPTEFDNIYSVYIEKCALQKGLNKPRGRDRVKAYLREMEQKGILNRERQGRQMIYTKCGGEVRSDEPPSFAK